jgi:uncharacterized LabA/DUF88 family protein
VCHNTAMVRQIQVDSADPNNDSSKTTEKAAVKPGKRKTAPKKQRVAIFIDGSNFYFKVRGLVPHKMNFIIYDYLGLLQELAGPDKRIVSVGYYVGVVRARNNSPATSADQTKTADLRKHQQQLFDQLRRQGIQVITGFLMQHDGRYYEKGVDVRLAVDIVDGAYNRKYDEALVISSDTDLLPAIAKAQSKGRHVQYVGFSHQPSVAMVSRCDSTRLLTAQDVTRYIRQERLPIKVNRYDDINK